MSKIERMSPSPADRIACRTPGCPNTIQPATAARNEGYCGPCAGKRSREAREAFVRANRKDLDRFAGSTDPVELLRLMHAPPARDPLVNLLPPPKTFEELYGSLTAEQAHRLMMLASEMLSDDEDGSDEISKCLAAFTEFALDPLLHAQLDHDLAYPALAFRGAGASVRDRLIHSLRNDASIRRVDHVLSALAWIGDDVVGPFLQRADAERPAWAANLYLPPTGYARAAGWELAAGSRRELTLPNCTALLVAREGEPGTEHVRVMQYASGACPWCGGRLVNLIEVDVDGLGSVALESLGRRIEVVTCPLCTCYGAVHAELDSDGRGHWAPGNALPACLREGATWDPSPWCGAAVRLSARPAIHAADWCLPTTLSQIGGLPAWVQDVGYPGCLKCGQTMTFIAQIDEAAFPMNEGIYYALACEGCRTTATVYQQT